jgi:hypothetical protein
MSSRSYYSALYSRDIKINKMKTFLQKGKFLPLMAMLLVVIMSGCNKDQDDPAVRPRVTSTNPVSNATGITVNNNISAIFSVPMDASTNTKLSLKQGTTNVTGASVYSGTTVSFAPTTDLLPNTLYTATVSKSAFNQEGTTLQSDYTWSFTTGALPDNTKPTVTLSNPLNNAIGININQKIVITFSEPMDQSTINSLTYSLKQGTANVAGTITSTETTATFTPSADLVSNKIYTATITVGAKDMAGNAIATNQVVTFTTAEAADVTLPMVNATDPLNNATGIVLNKAVSLTFSEAMNPLTITSSTFTLKQGANVVAGAITYLLKTATFTPSAPLDVNLVYTATITTGAKDVAGNALAANTVWSFTTVGNVVVNVTDPLNNATGIALNKAVSVTFSEAMNSSTITNSTFTLKQGTNVIAGAISYSLKTATFTPSVFLDANLVYTATITTGAKDLTGNALAANTSWSFTTSNNTSTLGVVNLGMSGNYVILAKTAINNSSTSAITGDLGLSPAATSYITGLALTNATGYATSAQVTGSVYAADMASPTPVNLTTAVADMITAYNDAAGRPSPDFLELATGNIGGRTLTKGLYKWTTSVTLPSDVVISGGANDVWIFQISGDLMMSSAVNITLIGGAQAKNIFWQVAGQATLGTTSHFEGIILSKTGVTFQTGSSINGRALAQTAVVLDSNAVTKPN